MKCVAYLSPTIQNELLEIIGKHIILRDPVKEINEACQVFYYIGGRGYFAQFQTVSTSFANVDAVSNIREEFLCFVHIECTTGSLHLDDIWYDIPVHKL